MAMQEDAQLVAYSTDNRAMIFSTAQLAPKTTRNTQGAAVLTLRKKATLDFAAPLAGSNIKTESRYRAKSIPAAGAVLKAEEAPQQQITLEL
jgi:DNA gyrase subunit A